MKPTKFEPVPLLREQVKLERIYAEAWYFKSPGGSVIFGFNLENLRVDQWVHFNVSATLLPISRGYFAEDAQYPQERIWSFPPEDDEEAGRLGPGKSLEIMRSVTAPTRAGVGNPRVKCVVSVSAAVDAESKYTGVLDLAIPAG